MIKEVQVTYEQIVQFRQVAELYLRNADKETLLYPAVDRMFKKLKKKHERYVDKQNRSRRLNAMIDQKTKKLLMSAGNYEYTQEGANKLDQDLRQLQYTKVTIKTEMLEFDQVPADLKFEFQMANGAVGVCTEYEVRSAFEGIVLPKSGNQEEEDEEEETED